MKKILALVMSLMLMLSLCACGGAKSDIADSTTLLNTVWTTYADNEKFSIFGGAMGSENVTMDAPGVFDITDASVIDMNLGFPAASIAKIDGAASMIHMMNANTFTCGAYHVVNSDDTQALVTEIKDNILARRWMCGFPEKLIVVTIDDLYIVSVFGNGELVETFKTKLTTAYPQAVIAVEQAIEG